MKLRRLISLIMLSVYLTSICGYAISIILCHCPHAKHYLTEHVGVHCGHCSIHHSQCDGMSQFEMPCMCKHKHTTEISLYDISKKIQSATAPAVLCQHPDLVAGIDVPEPEESDFRRFVRRNTPLTSSPHAECSALRAPPVLA